MTDKGGAVKGAKKEVSPAVTQVSSSKGLPTDLTKIQEIKDLDKLSEFEKQAKINELKSISENNHKIF